MKHRQAPKRGLLLTLGCTAIYLLVLLLLTAVERTDPEASIQSFTDALWYSVVTISTVGYGDLYPVTSLGKVLGVLFVLLSVGLLSFVIGAMISTFTGKLLPAFQRWMLRDRPWYVFSRCNTCSTALANDLAHTCPEAVFLFPKDEGTTLPDLGTCLRYQGSMEQIIAGHPGDCSLFFLAEADAREYSRALDAAKTGRPVYCMTEFAPERCPENLVLFNRYDCCAQEYWRSHGLKNFENRIVLIGDGKYAESLLLRGLLMNVISGDRSIQYHVFGDWTHFQRNHHRLGETLSLNREQRGMDSLFFHEESWNADPALLVRADRILLCCDEDARNLDILRDLRKYFPTGAAIHLRSTAIIPGETVFGTDQQMFTSELVMRQGLIRAARAMHDIYCEGAGAHALPWEALSEFLRQSNISAADHLLTKIRILLDDSSISQVTAQHCRQAYLQYAATKADMQDVYRWIEHQRWMRFHSIYNWQFGEPRDNASRIHPLMRPFADLTPAQQQMDDYAWELLEKLAQRQDLC